MLITTSEQVVKHSSVYKNRSEVMFYIDLDTDYRERYASPKFMEFSEEGHDILTSYFMLKIDGLKPIGSFTVTSEAGRPDVVSYKLYGSTQYWWVILAYNNMVHHDELVTGTVLKIPSLSDMESLYFQLKTLEAQQEGV